jgi:hypothetical protein
MGFGFAVRKPFGRYVRTEAGFVRLQVIFVVYRFVSVEVCLRNRQTGRVE